MEFEVRKLKQLSTEIFFFTARVSEGASLQHPFASFCDIFFKSVDVSNAPTQFLDFVPLYVLHKYGQDRA